MRWGNVSWVEFCELRWADVISVEWSWVGMSELCWASWAELRSGEIRWVELSWFVRVEMSWFDLRWVYFSWMESTPLNSNWLIATHTTQLSTQLTRHNSLMSTQLHFNWNQLIWPQTTQLNSPYLTWSQLSPTDSIQLTHLNSTPFN